MDLFAIFANVNGSSFVGLDTTTIPVLAGGKSNPMQGRIRKHMKGASVMVFQNKCVNGYEAMINRRLKAEGKATDFEVGNRAWGERLDNLPIVTHKGKEYLEVIFLKSGDVTYTLDGNPIAEHLIEGLKKDESKGQHGLDNAVIIRTFAEDSIDEIRIDGKVYN